MLDRLGDIRMTGWIAQQSIPEFVPGSGPFPCEPERDMNESQKLQSNVLHHSEDHHPNNFS